MNRAVPLLDVQNLTKHFDISGGFLEQLRLENMRINLKKTIVHALNDVSLSIFSGETFSVVGESGCGKSTLGRAVLGLYPIDGGQIFYLGKRIDSKNSRQMLPYRRKMQMVFQDPYASLNPRMKVEQTLMEPMLFHNPGISAAQAKERVSEVMEQVGVDPSWASRYPHEFSGGQRQRISIARALMVEPEFIVADEPISALDVSIQAQILNLFMDAQEDRGLTYMFITHDMSVVKHISTRVAVMYLGTICELAKTEELFSHPRHPYTKALLSAIPVLGTKKADHIKLKGEVPTPIELPSGCVFHNRCPYAFDRCSAEIPGMAEYDSGRLIACHGVEEGKI
ncbi:MAG TPA: ATP-binding cassette domain-containing protein [Deltaproteobacteria bacterium]|nr:ATP-binding cassette domain-containing protein [Deltaproteobacteria bacterium]HPJ92399.1 ATP-binding cassette domain-containing protein [Deltaproteobacteria bacterium]HPR50416.1 ATP-binding cassette domain-containing protein [Deltaproteobacteria bacterium]